jgi:hypothetical protein
MWSAWMLADLQPLHDEDHGHGRFRDTCGGGDGSVADPGLPQLLVWLTTNVAGTNPRQSTSRCATARSLE